MKNTGFLCFSLFCFSFSITACISSSKSKLAYNSANFVYTLAPLERSAVKPQEGVYYCIFMRSFADSNNNGIGDLRGLIEKLDYLNDGKDETTSDLGITGIWLMPIFPSHSYHGYDVDDYYNVNPDYGTIDDFEILTQEAKKRGITVILDMTFNHSSIYNEWFVLSAEFDSPYRNWYRWIDDKDERYNLNQKIWGHNVWNKTVNGYYAALFDSQMPDFNLDSKDVREELKRITDFWIDKGAAGFRFDAASHVFNSAELAVGENGQTKALSFWKEITEHILQKDKNAYVVGEVWEPASTRALYMRSLSSTFHFDLGTKIVDTIRTGDGGKNNLANSMYSAYQNYALENPNYIDAPFLTNHDQNRIAGMLKNDTALLKLAASLYLLTEGLPFIYYGEEIGLNGAKPDEQIRSPMLWNTDGKDRLQTRWLMSKYNKNTRSLADQEHDDESLLQYYKRLIRLRTALPALYAGRMKPFDTGKSAIVSWEMSNVAADDTVFVLHNVSDSPIVFDFNENNMKLIFASYKTTDLIGGKQLRLSPRGTAVLSPAAIN